MFIARLAERGDARGLVFRYFYGHDNRLTSWGWVVTGSYVEGDFSYKPPPSMASDATPVDCVGAIQYLYDAKGRLSDVIARAIPDNPDTVITHVRYEYDDRGNLIREWQADQPLPAPPTAPPTSTPRIDYAWAYQPTDTDHGIWGYDRLTSMTYPALPGGGEITRRIVQLAYGAPNSLEDRISRLTAISSGLGTVINPVAAFSYAGVSRRAAMTLSSGTGAITADMRATGSDVGLSGFDSFGRVRDLHYKNAASGGGQTLFRAQHAYDASGDRLWDKVTQADVPWMHSGGNPLPDARSQLHSFDLFHRLTSSCVERMQCDTNGWPNLDQDGRPIVVANSLQRQDDWNLDLLGNWTDLNGVTGNALQAGRVSHGNLDGYAATGGFTFCGGSNLGGSFAGWQDPCNTPTSNADDLQLSDAVNGRNEITAANARTNLNGGFNAKTTRYDAAGNLIFDGTYVYQYDAWGRLAQVNAGAVNGAITPLPTKPFMGLVMGPMLKHYTYDGVGRLVRTQSPFPDAASGGGDMVRSERFFYDGIRRIQERALDPTMTMAMAFFGGNQEQQELAQQSLDQAIAAAPDDALIEGGAAPVGLTNALTGGDLDDLGGGERLCREYIWGPGDSWGASPVDELLVYYAEGRVPWWPLQDAGGDVVAVCANGAAVPGGTPARVAAQQTYDAYGQVTTADHISNHPFLSVGHKGLFYDRFDRGVSDASAPGSSVPPFADSTAAIETPRLVPFARGVYHVRNRACIPGGGSPSSIGQAGLTTTNNWQSFALSQNGLSSGAAVQGRWMQADPNATGMVVITAHAFHGTVAGPHIDRFELDRRLTHGSSLYNYARDNPLCTADALGLYTQAEGYAVEAAVQDAYARSHPGDNIQYGKWVMGIPLKPDIVNLTTNRWAEVKPLTPSGIARAAVQGGTYFVTLGREFGMLPDITWIPPPCVQVGCKQYALWNAGGIIFYSAWEDATEETAFGAAAAMAVNSLTLGRSAVGRGLMQLLMREDVGCRVLQGLNAADKSRGQVGDALGTLTGLLWAA